MMDNDPKQTGEPRESDTERVDQPVSDDHSQVVYRRIADEGTPVVDPGKAWSVWTKELAPAVMPVVVGFMLLLILVSVLGFLSVRRMDEVSVAVLSLEQQHAAKLSLLLRLRLAVTKLNNEARSRADAESRGGLRPPMDMPLDMARDEVRTVLQELESPAFTGDQDWQRFRNDLAAYMEVTRDLREYSLQGFEKFRAVDTQLNALLHRSTQEQAEVFRQSELLEQRAARSIRLWTIIALIAGALVAAGTIWEIQRRFREMRRSMEEARRERGFTSQLLEGMVSAVAAIDEHDRIRSANAAFFKIFPGASIGASLYERFASDDALKMLEAATTSRVDEAQYRGRWVCPAGADCEIEQTFDVYSSPLAINGSRGQILTLVDVTEAAEAELGLRRQESLAAVGQATAQVAHEIRNPLGSIRLGVAMLRDNVIDDQGLNTIELVERGIKHLNKLVVDVAQFSRRKALERTTVDLHELINRSLELVADKIKEQDTPVKKHLTPETVVGNWDPDQLRQVFVNVMGNAIDASYKHAPISISTKLIDGRSGTRGDELSPKRQARITIADQGKGIDQASLDRIFEPFFSTKKRGTGLGLAIVKQIVEQHGGSITVTSEPEKGTRFTIDLPL
jgi:signal transduction histidine kinase